MKYNVIHCDHMATFSAVLLLLCNWIVFAV